jgi:hypothetical protein
MFYHNKLFQSTGLRSRTAACCTLAAPHLVASSTSFVRPGPLAEDEGGLSSQTGGFEISQLMRRRGGMDSVSCSDPGGWAPRVDLFRILQNPADYLISEIFWTCITLLSARNWTK